MPQPKNRKKGGNKQKRHPQPKHKKKGGHANKPQHKHPQQNHPKHKGKGKPTQQKKHQNNAKQLTNKQQQELLQSRMIDSIDSMYSQYANKHESMRTFFGIFTKHNQLQLRELMKVSTPYINKEITDKSLKTTQHDDNRDINQFIFLGDVVIGAYVTELKNNNKDCVIRALCVLPYFRNYGFGSRLLVNLIKNCVKRKKLVTISLFINEQNKKGILFFERFGFKVLNNNQQKDNKDNEKNGMNKNNNRTDKPDRDEKKTEKKSEKKDDINDNECKIKTIKMRLDLRIYRSSIMVLVKKQLKEQSSSQPSSPIKT